MAIYLHETVEATYGKVDEYCKGIGEIGVPAFNDWKLKIVGFYQNVFSSGIWPECVAIWSIEDWETYIWMMKHAKDVPGMVTWMKAAHGWRQKGFDRMFVPVDWSPTPPLQPEFRASGGLLIQQMYTVIPGRSQEFLAIMEKEIRPKAEAIGLTLEFIWRNNYNQFEFFGMWSVPSWEAYAEYQNKRDADNGNQLPGFDKVFPMLQKMDERVLKPTSYSPLGGGAGTVDGLMPNQ